MSTRHSPSLVKKYINEFTPNSGMATATQELTAKTTDIITSKTDTQMYYVHIDMDCFFAACEIKRKPELAAVPLVIGGLPSQKRGVVSTANYPARTFGIHSAQSIAKAHQLCPHATFLETDHYYYQSESARVMQFMESYFAPYALSFSQASIDEAYLAVQYPKSQLPELLERFQSKLHETLHYTCSVGVGNSYRVAKIASGHKKPAGVTIVEDVKSFLAPLPIDAISGIGKKSVLHYRGRGIHTVGDLAKLNPFTVLSYFGEHAITYWKLARGEYVQSVISCERDGDKSYSRETTFETDIISRCQILSELQILSKKVYAKLDSHTFKTVTLKVRFSDFATFTKSFTFSQNCTCLGEIILKVHELFTQFPQKPIRLLGVKLDHLQTSQNMQLLSEFEVGAIQYSN